LLVHDRLRVLLRDELGIPPGPAVQRVHRRLLGEATSATSAKPPAGRRPNLLRHN
jgi:Bacterial transcriptional activator domain